MFTQTSLSSLKWIIQFIASFRLEWNGCHECASKLDLLTIQKQENIIRLLNHCEGDDPLKLAHIVRRALNWDGVGSTWWASDHHGLANHTQPVTPSDEWMQSNRTGFKLLDRYIIGKGFQWDNQMVQPDRFAQVVTGVDGDRDAPTSRE